VVTVKLLVLSQLPVLEEDLELYLTSLKTPLTSPLKTPLTLPHLNQPLLKLLFTFNLLSLLLLLKPLLNLSKLLLTRKLPTPLIKLSLLLVSRTLLPLQLLLLKLKKSPLLSKLPQPVLLLMLT